MKKYSLFFLAIIFIAGCNIKSSTQILKEDPKNLDYIVESMSDVSISDAEVLYKEFSGISYFMKNAGKSIDSTPKLFKLIEDFQKEYEYKRDRYTKFSDAVAKYLEENGYKQPKNIVNLSTDNTKEIAREKVIEDMQNLANAIKKYMDSKKDVK